jgi:hypothetical protein
MPVPKPALSGGTIDRAKGIVPLETKLKVAPRAIAIPAVIAPL